MRIKARVCKTKTINVWLVSAHLSFRINEEIRHDFVRMQLNICVNGFKFVERYLLNEQFDI